MAICTYLLDTLAIVSISKNLAGEKLQHTCRIMHISYRRFCKVFKENECTIDSRKRERSFPFVSCSRVANDSGWTGGS